MKSLRFNFGLFIISTARRYSLLQTVTRALPDPLNHYTRSSEPSRVVCVTSTSVVFVIPIGFNRMSVSFLVAFDAFEFLTKGRSEVYGSRTASKETRTMGPRLANNGRKGAIEAAIIPRFISSLSLFQPQLHTNLLLQVPTRRRRH